jgi:hypothetical protein
LVFFLQQSVKLNSLNERLVTLQSQQRTKPTITRPIPTQYHIPKQDPDLPIIPDRPRLKDYLAAMKPETWGTTPNRSSAKIEENIYQPSPMSNMSSTSSFYNNTIPSSGPLHSNITEQNFTSLPSFNPHQYYQAQSSMSFASPPSVQTTPFSYQQPTFNQSNQNFGGQPQMLYHPPQQQFHPSQSYQPQQSVYQPTHNSGLQYPSMHQYQNISDPNRSTLPPLPVKFDPYRPQPVGAYDIPKPQQTNPPPPLMNPQDVYRPGGLLGMNQTQIPTSTVNNNNYDQNQFVQYTPSSFANLSINSMSNH